MEHIEVKLLIHASMIVTDAAKVNDLVVSCFRPQPMLLIDYDDQVRQVENYLALLKESTTMFEKTLREFKE